MDTRARDGIGMTSQRTRERLVARLGDAGIRDVHVLNCIRQVPRHLFVDEALASRAYEDTALPIGYGQTISQPFVVARMTEILIRYGIPERVLEIGTGSGYQAAILASLVGRVHTIERVRALHESSRQRFRELGFRNIRQRLGDGHEGWASAGPYNAIVLTAAPLEIPQTLLEQLAEGGQLLAPVGQSQAQELRIYERQGDQVEQRAVEPVSFVPMLGGTE